MVKTLQSIIDEAKKYLTDDFTLEDIYWIIEETLNIEKYQIFSKKYELFDDVFNLYAQELQSKFFRLKSCFL